MMDKFSSTSGNQEAKGERKWQGPIISFQAMLQMT